MPDLQYVFVTGATGAIGRAIALNIAGKGIYHVVLVARNEKKAAGTVEAIKETAC
jgi:short-subunit dehydrogenase